MLLVAEILLLGATLYIIALPLLGQKVSTTGELTENALSELMYKKDAAFIALKDLKFDHATGKIDEVDYEEMKTRFESDAIAVLKQIDDYRGVPKTKETVKPAEAIATADKKVRYCHQCGVSTVETHKFCSDCGAKL